MHDLTPYLRRPATFVWGLLMLATAASWVLGRDHQLVVEDQRVATVAVLAIAFVKVRLVGTHFMELGHAPRRLQLVFDAWVLVTGAVLAGIYLWG